MIPLNARSYTVAGLVGVALMLGAVVALGIMGNWLGFALSMVFLVTSVVFMALRRQVASHVPSLFDLLFVLAALVNGAGWIWNFYGQVFGYDEVAHAYTSFALSLWLGFLAYSSMRTQFRRLVFGLAVATAGLAAGAVWEMIEYTFVQLKDPVPDLMMDGIGAVLAGFLAAWILKRESREG